MPGWNNNVTELQVKNLKLKNLQTSVVNLIRRYITVRSGISDICNLCEQKRWPWVACEGSEHSNICSNHLSTWQLTRTTTHMIHVGSF